MSDPTPHTWVAHPDEAGIVASLLMAFRDHLGAQRPSDNALLGGVERLMENHDTEYLLAAPDDDSAAIGMVQLRFRFSVWEAAPDCWLEDLFVREAARGRGIGSALIELAMERARERGARRIELDTSELNGGALRLYERYGFSTTSKSTGGRDLFLGRRLDGDD